MPARAWLPGQRGSSAIAYTKESASSHAKIAQIPEAAVIYEQQTMAIQVGAISSFITSRNHYASGNLGLPLGLWLFACQAHTDVKRVFCRFGYSVSDSTARNALTTLTDASLNALKEKVRDATVRGETEYGKISDNVQRYERVFEHGLGKENELKHGTACTAFGLDDCKPGAFRASDHIARVLKQERQMMTVESLYDSIDWEHMDNVTDLHLFASSSTSPHVLTPFHHKSPLASVSPSQSIASSRERNTFNLSVPTPSNKWRTKAIRLAFATLTSKWESSPRNVTTKDVYTCYRNALSTPETWHTKSTKLNSSASNHYGPAASPDPLSLSRSSNAANMKRPTDLKKLVLGCDSDLLTHFNELADNNCLPSLHNFLEQASILRERYASQTAYEQSLDKAEQDGVLPRSKFPQGSAWTPPTGPEAPAAAHNIDTEMPGLDDISDDDEPAENAPAGEEPSTEIPTTPEPKGSNTKSHDVEEGPKVHKEPPGFDGDRVLSNVSLFLMEFGWWIELNYAIPEGDVGRLFEILKALLEFECSPELKEALLNNWLINLCGEIGKFIEGDLMQEWNNRWLTQISGQRGGDFDDKFYRKMIAPNVLHFLQIKEDIESAFELKRRSKSHTSPHLRDETKILLQLYREEELHSFRSGRSMGHAAVNQFDQGYQQLEDSKLGEYLQHSAEYAELLREMEVLRGNIPASQPITVHSPEPEPENSNSPTPSSESDENGHRNPDRIPSPITYHHSNPPSPVPDRDSYFPAPSSCRSPTASNRSSSSSTRSFRSSGSAASCVAADCVEEWDTIDHSDEPLLSGSDLTVIVDPETGRLTDDWYEPEEFEALVERLCGPELEGEESEDEEPESDEPETESEGEDPEDD
ncbi:hypothetical protein DFH09DRAFT_1075250 [Mycena vulgaris]|nr:hypothetical protein DFH09DRAFT_1075250 [Mycena vulgaris]